MDIMEEIKKVREEVIKDCKEKPFLLMFAILGHYDNLNYNRFKTELEAMKKLKELLEEDKKQIKENGYFAEISKSEYIETKN